MEFRELLCLAFRDPDPNVQAQAERQAWEWVKTGVFKKDEFLMLLNRVRQAGYGEGYSDGKQESVGS